jgi:NAD dependent epimerase/dehydratase family enzyme
MRVFIAGATGAIGARLVPRLVEQGHEVVGKHFDRSFAETNRLRTEGTDALLAAGREAGVQRFVAQSFAGWP